MILLTIKDAESHLKVSNYHQMTRLVLLQVIDDVANMGFSRHDVRSVVSELMDKGQAVDLNVVLDRLMNGPR